MTNGMSLGNITISLDLYAIARKGAVDGLDGNKTLVRNLMDNTSYVDRKKLPTRLTSGV